MELNSTGTGIRFDEEDQLAMDHLLGQVEEARMTRWEARSQLEDSFRDMLEDVLAGDYNERAYFSPEVL